jgi:predicted metal-dependent hydrolase
MRLVDVGGRLVEVHVRESPRAQRVRAVWKPGEPVELIVPVGTHERAVDRALRYHAPWIGRQLQAEAPRVLSLDGISITEREGRRLAREAIAETASRESVRLGVTYKRITIRDTRSRWGSCSTTGTLSFSWRLALAPREILDYVVVHELCHLRHHDHSSRFWSLVGEAWPQYREHKAWLDSHGWELLAYRPRA